MEVIRLVSPLLQVLCLLQGKVVVGHSIYNDFEVLDVLHPGHMVRDTCTTHLLSRLAGFPSERCTSLKILAVRLLNRKIQVSTTLMSHNGPLKIAYLHFVYFIW